VEVWFRWSFLNTAAEATLLLLLLLLEAMETWSVCVANSTNRKRTQTEKADEVERRTDDVTIDDDVDKVFVL
jgi:hypothetical protein